VATLDSTYPRSVLCRLGKDESTVEKAYEAKRANRHETVSDLAALADEMSEIGDMPDDLIELLTQVTP
jgi:hypothetical protein